MKDLRKLVKSETAMLVVVKVDSRLRMGWMAVDSIHLYASLVC